MACLLATGKDGTTGCPPDATGLDESQVWLFNREEVTFTLSSGKLYSGFTLSATKTNFRWKVHNKGIEFADEMSSNDTTGADSWAPRLTMRILQLDNDGSEKIEALRGTDLVAVVRTKAGRYIVLGSLAGLKLVENTTGSTADNYGETFVLGSDEEPGKHYELLDTDEATTLALLVAGETA